MIPHVTVFVARALICFMGTCHHALVGSQTPTGAFPLRRMATVAPGYGGDVLVFYQQGSYAWAIHRVYLLHPSQHRAARLRSDDPARRRITMGCINVDPIVYEQLVDCCSRSTVEILP